jgi:hypothetical protein
VQLGSWTRVLRVILTYFRARAVAAATEPNLGREEKPIRFNIVVSQEIYISFLIL